MFEKRKPFSSKERSEFVFKYNHKRLMRIEETGEAIYALEDNEIMQNGKPIVDVNYTERKKQAEKERIALLTLTKREVFLALYKAKGITPEQIKTQITEPETLIEFEYANEYFRGNPLIDLIGAKLGYTSDDLDYLFLNKELPVKEGTENADLV